MEQTDHTVTLKSILSLSTLKNSIALNKKNIKQSYILLTQALLLVIKLWNMVKVNMINNINSYFTPLCELDDFEEIKLVLRKDLASFVCRCHIVIFCI